VREKGKSTRRARWEVKSGCEQMALAPRKSHPFDAGRIRRSHAVTVSNPALPCPRMAEAFS